MPLKTVEFLFEETGQGLDQIALASGLPVNAS